MLWKLNKNVQGFAKGTIKGHPKMIRVAMQDIEVIEDEPKQKK